MGSRTFLSSSKKRTKEREGGKLLTQIVGIANTFNITQSKGNSFYFLRVAPNSPS